MDWWYFSVTLGVVLVVSVQPSRDAVCAPRHLCLRPVAYCGRARMDRRWRKQNISDLSDLSISLWFSGWWVYTIMIYYVWLYDDYVCCIIIILYSCIISRTRFSRLRRSNIAKHVFRGQGGELQWTGTRSASARSAWSGRQTEMPGPRGRGKSGHHWSGIGSVLAMKCYEYLWISYDFISLWTCMIECCWCWHMLTYVDILKTFSF